MAEAARSGSTPRRRALPEEIFIWEILVRLPPNDLLRCRAVCRAWRRATSTREFLLAHHGRQPSLPVVCGYKYAGGHGQYHQNFLTFDHRAADAQLQQVVRLDEIFSLEASCDGLFILSTHNMQYHVRNPATRQCARLQEIDGFKVLGMYEHGPTGEHRLLLYWLQSSMRRHNPPFQGSDGYYIFTLGSGQTTPRHIGCPEAKEVVFHGASLLFHGCLHWHMSEVESGSNMIMVFDTTAESFRQMPSPVDGDDSAGLFEMDGVLGMYRFCHAGTNIGIWLLQDYERNVWDFKCRVELPVAEIRPRFEEVDKYRNVVVASSCDGGALVLVRFGDWLLHVDIDGKLVARFHGEGLVPTQLRLKQTLVPRTFFPTL